MKSDKASGVGRLFGRARYNEAAGALLRGRRAAVPLDLFEAFFPADDGRQDLVNWQTIRGRLLAPHRPAFSRLRRGLEASLKGGGPRPEGTALLAYCDLFLGNIDRAAESMGRAVKAAPSSFGSHFLHAVCLWLKSVQDRSRDLLPEALAAVNEALRHDDKNVYAYYVRAGVRRELEDVAGRLADAETIIGLRPDFVWAVIEKAETLGETGRYRAALKELNGLIARYPKKAWGWAQRGRLRGIYGYHRLALADFSRALTFDPACGPIYAWRGEAWRRVGDYDKALEEFAEAIRLDPSYRLANQWRGRLHLLCGRYQAAIEDLSRAIALEPREQLAMGWRAEAWWKIGECRRAALGFDAIHPSEPKTTWNRLVRAGEVHEQSFHMKGGQGPERRERAFWDDLDAGVAARPGDGWAWAFRGRCRVAAGRLPGGLADLTRAVGLDAGLSYAYRWRGEGLRRRGAPARGALDLDRALALDPKDRWAAAYRALCRVDLGEAAAAAADFERALSPREQRFSCVHLWQGQWLHSLGRTASARQAIEAAFLLDGKDPRVLEWRKLLAESR